MPLSLDFATWEVLEKLGLLPPYGTSLEKALQRLWQEPITQAKMNALGNVIVKTAIRKYLPYRPSIRVKRCKCCGQYRLACEIKERQCLCCRQK